MPGLIPQEIIQEVLQQSNIVDVVGEYVALRKRGRNYFGLCPFHHEDTPSFSVNEEKQIYKCFGCGQGGNVIGFVKEVEHISFAEAVRHLADRCGIQIPEAQLSPAEQQRMQERQSLLAIHKLAAELYQEELARSRSAQAYLEKRGVDLDTARRFGLGAAPEEDWQLLHHALHAAGYSERLQILSGLVTRSGKNQRCYDKFHGRLLFPIRDVRGAVVAFGGRAIGEAQPKYLNSQTTPIYNKSQHLYGLDLAGEEIRRSGQVVLMEGYLDVITAHQYGVKNAVATLGTAFTGEQARLLHRYAPEPPGQLQVLLAFDGDPAGEKAIRAGLERLSGYPFVQPMAMVFPEQLDPDEFLHQYGQKGWQRLLEQYCYPTLDYLLRKAQSRYDANTAAGKGSIVTELLPAMRRCTNATELDSFILQLSRTLHVSEEAIRLDLARSGPAQSLPPTQPKGRARTQATGTPGRLVNRQLLIFALSDKKIFQTAVNELGEHFPSTEEEAQLIAFIQELGDAYTFDPRTLFNELDAEKEGLRQFLLKLIESDCPSQDRQELARDYIRRIQIQVKQDRVKELQRLIQEAERTNTDSTALLQEKYALNRELSHL